MKTALVILAALALAAAAQAASQHRHRHHPVSHATRPAQREIACTVVGCAPVPPGCHRADGKTLDGSPTGFEHRRLRQLHALRQPLVIGSGRSPHTPLPRSTASIDTLDQGAMRSRKAV